MTNVELIEGRSYPFTVNPPIRGDYCYWGRGWASCAPCYASFDGVSWDITSDTNFWIYTSKPEPFRHQYPTEEPPNDLATRLARYKEAKKLLTK